MKISKEDYRVLCNIAKDLNDAYEKEIDFNEMWDALNDVINNIEEEEREKNYNYIDITLNSHDQEWRIGIETPTNTICGTATEDQAEIIEECLNSIKNNFCEY